jgi:hypothetical protein
MQEGEVTTLDLKGTPHFTLVRPSVLPLDSEDGESLVILRQQHALIKHKWETVEDPVDGDIDVRGATGEGHHAPMLYDRVLVH